MTMQLLLWDAFMRCFDVNMIEVLPVWSDLTWSDEKALSDNKRVYETTEIHSYHLVVTKQSIMYFWCPMTVQEKD